MSKQYAWIDPTGAKTNTLIFWLRAEEAKRLARTAESGQANKMPNLPDDVRVTFEFHILDNLRADVMDRAKVLLDVYANFEPNDTAARKAFEAALDTYVAALVARNKGEYSA